MANNSELQGALLTVNIVATMEINLDRQNVIIISVQSDYLCDNNLFRPYNYLLLFNYKDVRLLA